MLCEIVKYENSQFKVYILMETNKQNSSLHAIAQNVRLRIMRREFARKVIKSFEHSPEPDN